MTSFGYMRVSKADGLPDFPVIPHQLAGILEVIGLEVCSTNYTRRKPVSVYR
jgi:hypothetical protein